MLEGHKHVWNWPQTKIANIHASLRLSYLSYIYIITNYALYLYLYIHLYTVNYIYLANLLCELNENAYAEVFSTVADIQ